VSLAPRSEIVGRDRELAILSSFVEGFPAGPACLVLEGAAGVGKTTLWRAAVDAARARGFTVLEARPVQAEATYAFTGVGDLLGPVLDRVVDELVAPQAHALRVALMLERPHGAPPDDRAIAVAALSALRVLATGGPVLLAVDDVQWLDRPSAAVLAFAWRRLENAPVGLAAGWRAGERVPDFLAADERTRHLTVEPLSLGAVHRLLKARLELVLPRPVLLRLHEVAGGNAFYALELGRALRRRDVLPAPGEPLPVPEQLRELMRERLAAMPLVARELLAATAALVQPTVELVVGELGGESALRAAVRANVLELHGDRLRFTHPLLAATAYEEVDLTARRALHRRLAKLVGDEEERARHLALGAAGPDPEVAAALERAAEHARTRGASTAAAELCELARRLTPAEAVDDRHRRAIAAARYRWLSGDTPGATAVLEDVIATARAGRLQAEARVTLASVLQVEGDHARAAELARQALAEPGIDDTLRAEAASRLAIVLMFMREELQTALEHARLAADIAERSGDPGLLARKLSDVSILQAMTGSPEAFDTARAAAKLGETQDWRGGFGSPSYDRATIAMWTDGHDEAAQLMRTLHDDALQRGDEGAIPHILAQRALADYLAGRWPDAARHADAGYEAAVAAGQRLSRAWTRSTRALVRASLGLENDARADAREASALAGQRGMGVVRIQSGWALGLLELSLDRPAEAVRVLTPLRERCITAGVGEPGSIRFVPDEVEALIALREVDAAIAVLDWLEQRARALDRVSALAAAWRCRGLLAAGRGEHDAALAAFQRALVEHERVAMPFERARTLLALGASRRRAKQRAVARATLGDALAIFEQLGAALWAAKARAELARIGGRTPAGDELTVTERRTAELVAQGLSNKQVAAALFVTVKTVETQLSRIYVRLDIHSRTQLAARLRSGDQPPTKP
jgi:DNA-binding CsgD family transcriptional regulator